MAQRTLTEASACLQEAIVENGGVGIEVASEIIATAQKKLEEANKMREGLLKSQTNLKKREKVQLTVYF